jgi:Family of unknown function (DUF5677)
MKDEILFDFEHLLKVALYIGDYLSVEKHKINSNLVRLSFIQGLLTKVINHSISVYKLYLNSDLQFGNLKINSGSDFLSIGVLTRATIETYLTFNFIYVTPKEEQVSIFRFKCWNFGGFFERNFIVTSEEELVKLVSNFDVHEMDNIKEELMSDPVYLTLDKNSQKKALNGDWRFGNSWTELAVLAGFNRKFFSRHYKFLCGYAHSGFISVNSARTVKSKEEKSKLSQSFLSLQTICLSKFLFDYINLIPEVEKLKKNEAIMEIIDTYKIVGEML